MERRDKTKTATDILKIPLEYPEMLFSPTDLKGQLRQFAKEWHPDICREPNADRVFVHINGLYNQAIKKIKMGIWQEPNMLTLTTISGTKYRIKYRYTNNFELGKMYVADTVLVYLVDKKYKDLFVNFEKLTFQFANDDMKKEMSRFLPKIIMTFQTAFEYVMIIEKTKDVIPLRCLLKYFKNKLDPKHVAWVMSGLHNILCYLEYARLVNNNISADTVFVSYKHHSVSLLGGWWYCQKEKEKLKSVPVNTYELMPPGQRRLKIAYRKLDGELVRALGREMLGDRAGGGILKNNKKIPEAFYNWVMLPSNGSSIKEYAQWMKVVLPAAYGKRRFIKMDVPINDIYKS